jgi:hypothetical protein
MIQYLIRADPTTIRLVDRKGRLPIECLLERKPFPEKLARIKLLTEADIEALAFTSDDTRRPVCNILSTLCRVGPFGDLLAVFEMFLALNPKAVLIAGGRFKRLPINWICVHHDERAIPLAEKLIAISLVALKKLIAMGCCQLTLQPRTVR